MAPPSLMLMPTTLFATLRLTANANPTSADRVGPSAAPRIAAAHHNQLVSMVAGPTPSLMP